jgi:type VII secretion-associated serine protease mycosin
MREPGVLVLRPRSRRLTPRRAVTACVLVAAALAAGTGVAQAQGGGQQARAADLAVLQQIAVPAAWHASKGSGVTVAVLDTGVNPVAPDLTGTVTVGPDYTAGANPPGYSPPHLHGTYIGSIIAGHGSGPSMSGGVIGVAPRAKILSVRVILDDQEPGFQVYNGNAAYYDAIAEGIRYAVRHGADVINMSLGSTVATRSMRLAIADAIAHGVVVVASAGNNGTGRGGFTPYSYPASFTGVISVAAVDASGQRASFSDRNASVVISAPGVNVVGDGPGNSYLTGSGTSPASAFVAGVAALVKSKYPRLKPVQVMQAIVTSARRRSPGGYSPSVGFGEVDAAGALRAAGRLDSSRPATAGTQAPTARFGHSAVGPIVVVPSETALTVALTAVAALAAIGFIASLVGLSRRRRRRASPPAPWPPGPSPPGSLPARTWPTPPTGPPPSSPPAQGWPNSIGP